MTSYSVLQCEGSIIFGANNNESTTRQTALLVRNIVETISCILNHLDVGFGVDNIDVKIFTYFVLEVCR